MAIRMARSLLKETPEDAILTAANLINHMGWVKGGPWLEEVILPEDFTGN